MTTADLTLRNLKYATIIAVAALMTLLLWTKVHADSFAVVNGWTVVTHVNSTAPGGNTFSTDMGTYFADGTYLIYSTGAVYVRNHNWILLGKLGRVVFPADFPVIGFSVNSPMTQVMVVPPLYTEADAAAADECASTGFASR